MIKKICQFLIPFVLIAFIVSCGTNQAGVEELTENQRDNIINIANVVSLDDNLPDMHSYTNLIMVGDTLLFHDFQSTNLQFAAYDIIEDKTIGNFGKFGNGPGEIANFGALFYVKTSKTLYGANANQGKIVGFYLPDAIKDSNYLSFDKIKMDFSNGNNAILNPHYFNDSTIICTVYVPSKEARSIVSHIGNLNMVDGTVSIIDSIDSSIKLRSGITVSQEKNRIFAADKIHDLIRIFNLDGKPLRYIYGPDYEERTGKTRYFSALEICGDKFAAVYSGEPALREGKDIIIMDFDGKYLKTLRFDLPINTIAYNPTTDRLYLSTNGDPQFCYINLQETLDGRVATSSKDKAKIKSFNVSEKKNDEAKEPKPHKNSSQQNLLPLTLMDKITHHSTPVDTLNIGAYKYQQHENKYAYTVGIKNFSKNDTVYIDSIILPDNSFIKSDLPGKGILHPGVLTTIWLWCDKPLPRQNYTITVKYKDDKYPQQKLPLKLHPSGAQLYEDYHSKGHY